MEQGRKYRLSVDTTGQSTTFCLKKVTVNEIVCYFSQGWGRIKFIQERGFERTIFFFLGFYTPSFFLRSFLLLFSYNPVISWFFGFVDFLLILFLSRLVLVGS